MADARFIMASLKEKALNDPDVSVRCEACTTLAHLAHEPPVFRALLAVLADDAVGTVAEQALDVSYPHWRRAPETLDLLLKQLEGLGNALPCGTEQDDWPAALVSKPEATPRAATVAKALRSTPLPRSGGRLKTPKPTSRADPPPSKPTAHVPGPDEPAALRTLLRVVGDRQGLLFRMVELGEPVAVRRAAFELLLRDSSSRRALRLADERSNDLAPEIRLRALQVTAKLEPHQALDIAARAAVDPSPLVRAFAGRIWASRRSAEGRARLSELLDDPAEEVRIFALEQIVEIAATAHPESLNSACAPNMLLRRLATASPVEATAILRALDRADGKRSWVSDNRDVLLPTLQSLLGTIGGEEAAYIAELCALCGSKKLLPYLVPLLADAKAAPAARTALDAVESGWRTDQAARAAIPALQRIAASGERPRAFAAALVLTELEHWNAVGVLLRELGNESCVQQVQTALRRTPSPDLIPKLAEALADPRAEVREHLVELMVDREPHLIAPMVARVLLEDAQPSLRVKALELLGAKAASTSTLLVVLADCEPRARTMAATILGQRGAREAIDGLVLRLTDESDKVRESAREALDRIDPLWPTTEAAQSHATQLAQGLEHHSAPVRAAALRALGLLVSATRREAPSAVHRADEVTR